MKRFIEVVVVVALLIALFYGCTYAMDNDPSFQGSKTYTGHGGYNAE